MFVWKMFNFVIKGMGISLYRHKWLCIAVRWYQFENNLHENNPVISTVHNTFSRGWKAANLNFSVFRRIIAGKDGSLIIVRLYNSSQQIITLTIFNCPSLACANVNYFNLGRACFGAWDRHWAVYIQQDGNT